MEHIGPLHFLWFTTFGPFGAQSFALVLLYNNYDQNEVIDCHTAGIEHWLPFLALRCIIEMDRKFGMGGMCIAHNKVFFFLTWEKPIYEFEEASWHGFTSLHKWLHRKITERLSQ